MSDWIDVAPQEEFRPGERRIVDVDDIEVAVFNVGGIFHAIEDVCTHDGGELASGELRGEVIECPRHGAQFSVRTGEVLAPPAYEPVAVYPVRVENGMVQVGDEPAD